MRVRITHVVALGVATMLLSEFSLRSMKSPPGHIRVKVSLCDGALDGHCPHACTVSASIPIVLCFGTELLDSDTHRLFWKALSFLLDQPEWRISPPGTEHDHEPDPSPFRTLGVTEEMRSEVASTAGVFMTHSS